MIRFGNHSNNMGNELLWWKSALSECFSSLSRGHVAWVKSSYVSSISKQLSESTGGDIVLFFVP